MSHPTRPHLGLAVGYSWLVTRELICGAEGNAPPWGSHCVTGECCGKPRKLLVLCCVISSPGYARGVSRCCCSKKEKSGSGQQQPLPQGTGLRQIALWRETRSPHQREEEELPPHSAAPEAAAGPYPSWAAAEEELGQLVRSWHGGVPTSSQTMIRRLMNARP